MAALGADGGALGRPALWVAAALLTACVGAVLVEIFVRVTGHRPAAIATPSFENEPVMHQFDPVLGWRVTPGAYRFPGYTPDTTITMTFWPDGSRATETEAVERSRRVVLLGDSFTTGWAVSDDETYAWKLHERFPSTAFRNYGTPGYSTYQALLRLRQELAPGKAPPAVVVYGFDDDQERRNVGDAAWLRGLAVAPRRAVGETRVPYCLLDATGALVEYPPELFRPWPLRTRSATVALLEERWVATQSHRRGPLQTGVTQRLVEEMRRLSEASGTRYAVALLTYTPEISHRYAIFLRKQRIRFSDCQFTPTRDFTVPGEGHPNGKAHTAWAACIADGLRDLLE